MKVLAIVERGLEPEEVRAELTFPDAELEIACGFEASSVGGDHDLLAVACSGYADELSALVERSMRHDPGRPVVIVSWSATTGFLRSLLAEGAAEILTMPADRERLPEVFATLVARAKGTAIQTPLVAVIGSKGGTGKTLTASNLAVALASGKQPRPVAIVDNDLQFGDVGITLGLQPVRTVYDLVRTGGRIDTDKVRGFLTKHAGCDVSALLAPLRPEQANAVSQEFMQEIYRLLRQDFDCVVVDTCPGFPPDVLAAIDASTHLVVVGEMSAAGLKDTRLGLETLEKLGYDQSRIFLLLNKADSSVGLTDELVQGILGRKPDAVIPYDKAVTRSSNLGQPLALQHGLRSSDAAKVFRRVADWVLAPAEAAASQPVHLPIHQIGKATA